MQPSIILVTDGEQRAALAVTRSLGGAGHRVYVAAQSPRALAAVSRYCAGFVPSADPLTAPSRFGADIVAAVRAIRPAVVLPVTDQATFALLDAEPGLGDAILPVADKKTVHAVADKSQVLARAVELGIAAPGQQLLVRPHGVLPDVAFPVVIKPSRSVSGGAHLEITYAADVDGLRRSLRDLPAEAYPVLLQQRIVGPGIGVFLLLWDGKLVASFAHTRVREFPPAGGASTLSRSIPLPSGLLDQSLRLMQSFAWRGVAMVEYKCDAAKGRPYLMEVNGRFWGSLQLAIDAGVDFPRLLVEVATGHVPRDVSHYKAGVGLRSLWRDIDHLLLRLRYPPERLNLPADAPSKLATLASFLAWRFSERSELFRFRDMAPFWEDTRAWFIRRAFGRVSEGKASR